MADPVSELDDAAARIQYSFHAADARGIQDALNLVQRIELTAALRGMKDYYLAYGQWKLAELQLEAAAKSGKSARANISRSGAACATAAEAATRADARLAEAYAIEAICSTLASRAPTAVMSDDCTRHKAFRMARELEPHNPRIGLIEVQCLMAGEKASAATLSESLRTVVAAFDAAPPSRPGRPDWGHAEALLLMGRVQAERGEAVAARDSLERALVIAPDFRAAREQLEKAAPRPL